MKTKLTALALITVTALSLAPKPAQANDKGLALLGGFLGGLIVASAINDSHYEACPPARTAVVAYDRDDRCVEGRDAGYWKDIAVRTWVDDRWITRYECERYVNVFIPAHYEVRRDRVWVAFERYDRRDYDESRNHYDRRDHEAGYGYRHRR